MLIAKSDLDSETLGSAAISVVSLQNFHFHF